MLVAVVFAALVAVAVASGVQVLTPENFDQVVDGSKPAFVEFYAPWCGHCKRLEPEYDKVGEAYANNPTVVVGKVDADAHKDLGGRFGVRGFPTLKFFPKGWKNGDEPTAYEGGRTADDIINYIRDNANARPKLASSPVVELTNKNFDAIVKDPSKDVLVEFYAPWCGHCKHLAPDYDKVALAFKNEKDVVVAKIDADKAEHKDLAGKYGVSGFPTLKFFPKSNKDGEDYSAGRDPESFVKFLNDKSGTHRTSSGALSADAGRVPALDALATKFVAAGADHKSLLAEARKAIAELTGAAASSAKFYLKAFEKVQQEGVSFVKNELARLRKLIESPSTAASKIDEFTIRSNILVAFQQPQSA